MAFGFNIPNRGPLATQDAIAAMARRGDALGYRYLAVPDHLVIPRAIDSRYPYSASGAYPGLDTGECFEQLTLMAWLAAITERAHLLSSVMVVPHRGAVHTAKILATIDRLSGGRLAVGVGAGWMREEFEAIGAPPFDARGKVTDEWIAAWKVLWTEDDPRFEGEHVRFGDLMFAPKPVQRPHPPIWVGGESGPALRRTARLGDVWYPIGSNPRHPLDTLERFEAGLAKLRRTAEVHDRDPASIDVVYWANWYDESRTATLDDGSRMLFTGEDAQVAGDIRAFRDLGVRHVLFNFQRDSLERSLDSMQRFAEVVVPLAGETMA